MLESRKITYAAALLLPVLSAAKILPTWFLPIIPALSSTITTIFIKLLQLVSLPIIFLSITSTLTQQDKFEELKVIGTTIVRYTLATTLIASGLSGVLYHIFQPHLSADTAIQMAHTSLDFTYSSYLMDLIPSNFFAAFVDQNVIGVMVMAFGIGLASFSLPQEQRSTLKSAFSSLYNVVFGVTTAILKYLPIVIWAYYSDLLHQAESLIPAIGQISRYVACIVSANLIHASVFLTLMLRAHKISPMKLFKQMYPALQIAFWSKSSNASLPSAIKCLHQSDLCDDRIANISMPLCISINMNACAAFILITVHFVAHMNGLSFSYLDTVAWAFIATLAAIGNAGVPMGCYFLASALLTSLGTPLDLMGLILPVYGLIDMLESAINVWSDACVSACTSKVVNESADDCATSQLS